MYIIRSTLCILLLSLLSQTVFSFTISLSFPYASVHVRVIHIFSHVHVHVAIVPGLPGVGVLIVGGRKHPPMVPPCN